MDTQQFWKLIEEARSQALTSTLDDGYAVAERAAALLALRPVQEIVAAQQAFWDLMTDSYRAPLWGAAYVINGGCSDDGFDYFRGWLITQGRETFERVITDPDALADLPTVGAFAERGIDGECEAALSAPGPPTRWPPARTSPVTPSPSAIRSWTPNGTSTSRTATS
ncbi:DUF4240 domain-containing protein [Kitasatospora herbaricolor]|uniref:DUF4240 domain-containing protein n=1 Tax=Kitasatospora herbaricolor TaxID=68217 RepID=UPI002E3524D3|nr:DUF4240 domain-containing protein [Kitasatospora herbaricolor]